MVEREGGLQNKTFTDKIEKDPYVPNSDRAEMTGSKSCTSLKVLIHYILFMWYLTIKTKDPGADLQILLLLVLVGVCANCSRQANVSHGPSLVCL